jgi:hypothetical protein
MNVEGGQLDKPPHQATAEARCTPREIREARAVIASTVRANDDTWQRGLTCLVQHNAGQEAFRSGPASKLHGPSTRPLRSRAGGPILPQSIASETAGVHPAKAWKQTARS